jgi:GPN-loop GTPase
MQDFEVFQEALATHQSTTDDDGAPTYMNSLMNSMSLVLDEFYKHLKVGPRGFPFILQTSLSQSVGVSSMTGDGVAEFFQAVEASREEYERSIPLCYLCYWSFDLPDFAHREYLPELARVRAQREATLQKQKEDSTARMLADLAVDRASDPNFAARDRWNPGEEEEEEDDGGEQNIIDRSASIISGHSAFPFAFRLSRHSGNSWRHVVRQELTWLVRCYPLLASLADLIVCHVRSEAMGGVKRGCLTSLLNCDFYCLFKIAPSAVLTNTYCR